MSEYLKHQHEEKEHLNETLELIQKELKNSIDGMEERKRNLIATRKEMWENSGHSSNDFTQLTGMNQQLWEVNNQTGNYINAVKHVHKLERMKESPYFGRFDFKEAGYDDTEKIYIGISNLMDPETHDIYVYDWRASISSMFYQHEIGEAEYSAPVGTISGELFLKRQFKIQNSQLKYFFDCSVKIDDEMLREILSNNSSSNMKSIVETIQKEQDIIIRDVENDLLIVQGVAGSGKTSIALHRIAYLLYVGLNTGLNSKNFIILSPNAVFSKYISNVLPELGEEDINQTTFEELVRDILKDKVLVESRIEQLESIIVSQGEIEEDFKRESIAYKGSREFVKIIDRYLEYYQRNSIQFQDVYYHGRIIETKQGLKSIFLNNKIDTPIAKRLSRIETMLFDRIRPFQRERIPKIQELVRKMERHELEVKSFSRLLELKRFRSLSKSIRKFTEIDFLHVYYSLFNQKGLLKKLSNGLEFPDCMDEIIDKTKKDIENGCICFEDCGPLLYLKLKLEGNNKFHDIKNIVIDEAQDYYPIQYEVIKLLFNNARFTVLGDISQEIEKDQGQSVYDSITEILGKKKSVKLTLNKSYRSSYEISKFNQKLLSSDQKIIPFERHETEPTIVEKNNEELLDEALIQDIDDYKKQGYESIAIVCKSQKEAEALYKRLIVHEDIKIVDSRTEEVEKGVSIIPTYMAKGLEFDVVMVYDVSKENYDSQLDKRLLYIACTRALHRLSLYYSGEKCSFIL